MMTGRERTTTTMVRDLRTIYVEAVAARSEEYGYPLTEAERRGYEAVAEELYPEEEGGGAWSVIEAYRENGRTHREMVEDGLSEEDAYRMASEHNESLRAFGVTGHWTEAVKSL